jgi:hypothetical protein
MRFYSVWTLLNDAGNKSYHAKARAGIMTNDKVERCGRKRFCQMEIFIPPFAGGKKKPCDIYVSIISVNQWRTEGGIWGVNPPPSKFRSFAKAEPNSQFRGIYIRNNLIRIWGSFICKLSGTPD